MSREAMQMALEALESDQVIHAGFKGEYMTDKELMQKALEKLEFFAYMRRVSKDTQELINILRKRLSEMN
jgi:hypothetical protein